MTFLMPYYALPSYGVEQRESLEKVVVDVEDGDAFPLCVQAGGIRAAPSFDHRRDHK